MSITAVTGATGFIGSALVRQLLRKGRKVRALIEPGANTQNLDTLEDGALEKVSVDVCDFEGMQRALEGVSSLYHLAAIYKIWLPDPSLIYRVNLEGTSTTLLAAQKEGVEKIVYTSSVAAVGLRDDQQASDESVDFNLFDIANPYILTKYLSERIAVRFFESGLPVVIVNPGFPFGERDTAPTPTGKIILSLLRGQVPGYTKGGFCAIDVEDVAAGHILAEEKGKIGERYILGNYNITWKNFFQKVSEVAGCKAPGMKIPAPLSSLLALGMEWYADNFSHREPLITYKSARYAHNQFFFNNAKARIELGLPQTPLEDSITHAVRFFRETNMV